MVRSKIAWLISLVMLAPASGAKIASAADSKFKANILPKAQERKWVAAVRSLKTKDGSSLGETLDFVSKMRPRQFKIKEISPGYGQDGNPHGMNVCYWIGLKRLEGDQYCNTGWRIAIDGDRITATPDDDPGTDAFMSGRDGLLKYIDESYESDCTDFDTKKKTC